MLHSSVIPAPKTQLEELSRLQRFTRSARELLAVARIFLVVSAIAFWLGGFTFYAGVAVPMGVQVLGGHRAFGFVTARVTNWLNVAGVIALAIFFCNTALGWRVRGKAIRRTMLITVLVMAIIEIELIVLHPLMDRQMVYQPRHDILDDDQFELLHHIYLISTTVQWAAGMVHVWCICVMWRSLPNVVAAERAFD